MRCRQERLPRSDLRHDMMSAPHPAAPHRPGAVHLAPGPQHGKPTCLVGEPDHRPPRPHQQRRSRPGFLKPRLAGRRRSPACLGQAGRSPLQPAWRSLTRSRIKRSARRQKPTTASAANFGSFHLTPLPILPNAGRYQPTAQINHSARPSGSGPRGCSGTERSSACPVGRLSRWVIMPPSVLWWAVVGKTPCCPRRVKIPDPGRFPRFPCSSPPSDTQTREISRKTGIARTRRPAARRPPGPSRLLPAGRRP